MTTERPIIFKDDMVRAILDGRKTQTRRAVKGDPVNIVRFVGATDKLNGEFGLCCTHEKVINKHVRCPYGQPGDRLWVRETWAAHFIWEPCAPSKIPYDEGTYLAYRADDECTGCDGDLRGKWRPSIHMPRWASRITLEITDVRVERLQDISAVDAKAEGVAAPDLNGWCDDNKWFSQFAWLWQSINGPDSWDANPWVWVIEFRRVAP